jgi:hypothetical protein
MRSYLKSNQKEFRGKPIKNQEYTLRDGEKGSLDTVSLMIEIARKQSQLKEIRDFAIDIVNQYKTKSHEHLKESASIGDFIKNNVQYLKDIQGVELLHDPLLMIADIKRGISRGDCDDMALLTATLLLSIGIKPYFKIVRWRETKGNYNHIYVMVNERNGSDKPEWLALDCILKDKIIGTELPSASSKLIPS